jgi:hypothetical protein
VHHFLPVLGSLAAQYQWLPLCQHGTCIRTNHKQEFSLWVSIHTLQVLHEELFFVHVCFGLRSFLLKQVYAVYAKVFWTTQDIRSDVINEHTGPNQILSDGKTLRRKKKSKTHEDAKSRNSYILY